MSTSYSVSTIAKLFDLTERRVQQLAKEGIIPKAAKGKYELVPAVQGYIKYLRASKEDTPTNISAERARLLKMQADKLSMAIDLEREKLLDADKAAAGWDNLIARCRSNLLGIPSRLAFQVTVVEPREAERLMKSAIYDALTELSNNKNIGTPLDDKEKKEKFEDQEPDNANEEIRSSN